jgi:hypothetical protein
MEGILDLIKGNDWIVRYIMEDPYGLSFTKSIPLSRFNKIMYKKQLYIGANIIFELSTENDHKSLCHCSEEEYDNCEFFVKSGINDCLNYENIEVEVAKISKIEPKKILENITLNVNETFDRETVKNLLIEVKNRFAVMSGDNYNSDSLVIEWFERNFPLTK